VRVAVRGRAPSGFSAALELASGPGSGFVETSAFIAGGYHLGVERGRWGCFAGVEVGAGFVARSLDGGGTAWSPLVGGAPHAGVTLRLGGRAALALEAAVAILWARDGRVDSAAILPGGRLGLFVDL